MDRRSFFGRVATVAAVGAEAAAAAPKETRGVTYNVQGFTCITCAVGLETMLAGLKGVTRAKASYPEHSVAIGFNERAVSEKTIKDFIQTCGFTATPKGSNIYESS